MFSLNVSSLPPFRPPLNHKDVFGVSLTGQCAALRVSFHHKIIRYILNNFEVIDLAEDHVELGWGCGGGRTNAAELDTKRE